EVDRGNIGRRAERQSANRASTAAALTIRWNGLLIDCREPVRLFPAYRHTGNYRITAERALPVADVQAILSRTIRREFAVFTVADFLVWVTAAQASAVQPTVPPDRRATLGAVMDLNAAGAVPPTVDSDDRWIFDTFAVPRVRVVWKVDLE